jgi:hypothetical protein
MKSYVRLYGPLLLALLISMAVQAPRTAYGQCTAVTLNDPSLDGSATWPAWQVKTSVVYGNVTGPMCSAAIAGCVPSVTAPRSGAGWAWFGAVGSGTAETATIGQTGISIPAHAGGRILLRYYLRIQDVNTPFNDTWTVETDFGAGTPPAAGTVRQTITEPSSPDSGYVLRIADLSALTTGAHSILFRYVKLAGPTGGGNSNFVLDDIGLLNCAGPTASGSALAGRILRADGSPIAGTTVRIIGSTSRLAITDATGFYYVEGLTPGGLYTVTPDLANYQFSPAERSFSLNGNMTEAEFTGSADAVPSANAIDSAEYFVRQQYLDFLGREPDEAGLNFWVNNILSCGNDASCVAAKRVDTSAAFFLSTEFEQTGVLVYRTYQSAYGDMPGAPLPLRRSEFKPDAARLGSGVVVNQDGWRDTLDNNKRAYMEEFVQRARFVSAYPVTMSPAEFVDRLFMNAGVIPGVEDRSAAIGEFGLAGTSSDVAARGRALLRVAENPALAQQESNQAFVAMQYLGYLGRDANDAPDNDFSGYNFWLNKLNSFNGDFRAAEMVRAFLISSEYRGRFHQ